MFPLPVDSEGAELLFIRTQEMVVVGLRNGRAECWLTEGAVRCVGGECVQGLSRMLEVHSSLSVLITRHMAS